MSGITAAIWITSISTRSNMVMYHGWPIGRIPPSIVMWRAASIRQIGAGRWMGRWGIGVNPEKKFSIAIIQLLFTN